MAIELYIIPIDSLANGYQVPRFLPHRFQAAFAGLEGVEWTWTTWLLGDTGILICDVTPTESAILSARPQVFPIPNLDATVPNTNIRNQIRNRLEGSNIPGTWVNTGMAYRLIMRTTGAMFDYYNAVVGLLGASLFGALTLDSTVSQLSQAQVNALQQAATALGLTYSATGTTTLRALILSMGQQRQNNVYVISGRLTMEI